MCHEGVDALHYLGIFEWGGCVVMLVEHMVFILIFPELLADGSVFSALEELSPPFDLYLALLTLAHHHLQILQLREYLLHDGMGKYIYGGLAGEWGRHELDDSV